MIELHRPDGGAVTVNAEHILSVEATPDTLVTMVGRRRLMVAEPVDEVVEAVIGYHRELAAERSGGIAPVAA